MARTQPNSGDADGPTVLRMIVGAQLRRLREERGIGRAEAGHPIRGSESKISRMELGRVSFKERDVADLLTHYGVPDGPERAALLAQVREANAPAWWKAYADVAPNWFHSYLGLEAATSLIRTYEVQFVPGLLQTEDYARAVVSLGHPSAPAAEVERRVRLRMDRQRLLTQPHAPRFWAVVDEGALQRPVGGVKIMRDQLEALIGIVTKLTSVRLQVIPFAVGGHAAAGGSFTILRFPHDELPDLVYLEQLTSALYRDKREDVDHYAATMDRLAVEAAPAAKTVDTLERILRELR